MTPLTVTEFPEKTPNQEAYQKLYFDLGNLQLRGLDVDEDPYANHTRRRLWATWLAMSAAEREPFLAPGCLDRNSGPVNKDYCRHKE